MCKEMVVNEVITRVRAVTNDVNYENKLRTYIFS